MGTQYFEEGAGRSREEMVKQRWESCVREPGTWQPGLEEAGSSEQEQHC